MGAKITTTLNALAERNRLSIVEILRDGPFPSKHLRVLSQAGFVEVRASANRGIYRLRLEPFQALDVWLETYRGIWEKRLDNLEEYLQKMQSNKTKS